MTATGSKAAPPLSSISMVVSRSWNGSSSGPITNGPEMRILIATDAWYPQVNGVVRTLEETAKALRALGHQLLLLTPEGHATIPLPLYSEIRLAIPAPGDIGRAIEAFAPEAIYIATE